MCTINTVNWVEYTAGWITVRDNLFPVQGYNIENRDKNLNHPSPVKTASKILHKVSLYLQVPELRTFMIA